MAEFGQFALLLGLFLSMYATLVDPLGGWKKDANLIRSGRNATIACLGCLTIATLMLWWLLLKGDFTVKYVAEHTSKALPIAYRISALWAGAAGSLLLWLWIQVGLVVFVFCRVKGNNRIFAAGARGIANFVSVFFFLVLILDKNPFTLFAIGPNDGMGLNPLLQHPAMVLHPPTLFIGYAALIVPFAWSFSSLKNEDLLESAPFLERVRKWTLWAWMFLTIGIVLGAWWAYEELGWGGYWAWDPVENSSLMPWLTATALLHCSRFYNRKTTMATWFVVMSILSFSLCIFGTFLTRYGLVSSVHAFPDPGLGILFLVLIAHLWVIAAILLWKSLRDRKDVVTTAIASNMKYIIYNNWLMILLTFVIFIGTLFPFFTGLLSSQKITLKPEYFTKITAPGGLAFLFLLGICPYLLRHGIDKSWRSTSAIIAVAAALLGWLISRQVAVLCFVVCVFATINLIGDFITRYKKSTPNLRWLGTRAVHLGVIMVFAGIAGSGGYDKEAYEALKPGDHVVLGSYKLVYEDLKAETGSNFTAVTAGITVYGSEPNSPVIARLNPSKAFYQKSDKSTSEVDIKRTFTGDLYTAIDKVDTANEVIHLKVLIKPLINWIWIGSTVSMIGTVLVLISLYRKKKTTA